MLFHVLFMQALRNFEKAVHMDPSNPELWSEDLQWAWKLVKEKEKMDSTEEQERD